MESFFQSINNFFEFIVPIADFLWDFPTNFEWYSNIPILGKFSLAILLLLGTGIYFTIKTRFVQVSKFTTGIKILTQKNNSETGVSPLASFLLSSAMRVGPGNIMGVTGAVSVGGPGAIFWMWISAFFGMSLAFSESVLAQLFKEKKNDEYVGGLPFYGMKILGNRKWVGITLSLIFILYALFCIPAQTFNLFTAFGNVASTIVGKPMGRTSAVYIVIGILILVTVILTIFGGIRRVTGVTDIMVPVMAVVYIGIILILIVINIGKVPFFFSQVFGGAFTPQAVFGGAFGTALAQGIKRGLMSNEAGQGTITMAAAIAHNDHPAEQGFIQAVGVFLDTMIICTMSGFVVVMAHLWTGAGGVAWDTLKESKLDLYMTSVKSLIPGTSMDSIVVIILSICYGLFAFTTLLGMISFAEISANFISKKASFIKIIRILGSVVFVGFGVCTVWAGLELGNLWYISDFVNILVVYCNVPIVIAGSALVFKVYKHYLDTKGGPFNSRDIGIDTDCWDGKNN